MDEKVYSGHWIKNASFLSADYLAAQTCICQPYSRERLQGYYSFTDNSCSDDRKTLKFEMMSALWNVSDPGNSRQPQFIDFEKLNWLYTFSNTRFILMKQSGMNKESLFDSVRSLLRRGRWRHLIRTVRFERTHSTPFCEKVLPIRIWSSGCRVQRARTNRSLIFD